MVRDLNSYKITLIEFQNKEKLLPVYTAIVERTRDGLHCGV